MVKDHCDFLSAVAFGGLCYGFVADYTALIVRLPRLQRWQVPARSEYLNMARTLGRMEGVSCYKSNVNV